MAVTATVIRTGLQMKMNAGNDESGKAIIRSKTYSGIKIDALDENIHGVGAALAGLQRHPVNINGGGDCHEHDHWEEYLFFCNWQSLWHPQHSGGN